MEKPELKECVSLSLCRRTFKLKGNKKFRTWTKKSSVFFVFRDSYVLCIYVMNILCTFHISVSGYGTCVCVYVCVCVCVCVCVWLNRTYFVFTYSKKRRHIPASSTFGPSWSYLRGNEEGNDKHNDKLYAFIQRIGGRTKWRWIFGRKELYWR